MRAPATAVAGRSVAGPPIRFLALVCGGWAVARAALLWPGALAPGAPAYAASAPPRATVRSARPGSGPVGELTLWRVVGSPRPGSPVATRAPMPLRRLAVGQPVSEFSADGLLPRRAATVPPTPERPSASALVGAPASVRSPPGLVGPIPPSFSRLAAAPGLRLEAALYLRSGGFGRPLEPSLGGSQAIVSARLPIVGRLAASTRLTSALDSGGPRQAEVALGVAARPLAGGPVELIAERRVALSRDGRDAWQLRAAGGGAVERRGWRLEGYAQTGVVGARARDLFADGQAHLSHPVAGRLRLGAVVAGAAQPGARRLDAGPQLRLDLPAGSTPVSLVADYRLRVAGNAAPASGPSLTLAASF